MEEKRKEEERDIVDNLSLPLYNDEIEDEDEGEREKREEEEGRRGKKGRENGREKRIG